jgi:hypothetical protein
MSVLSNSFLAPALQVGDAFTVDGLCLPFELACQEAVTSLVQNSSCLSAKNGHMDKAMRRQLNAQIEIQVLRPVERLLPAVQGFTSAGHFAACKPLQAVLNKAIAREALCRPDAIDSLRDVAAALNATVHYKLRVQRNGTAFEALRRFWACVLRRFLDSRDPLAAEFLVQKVRCGCLCLSIFLLPNAAQNTLDAIIAGSSLGHAGGWVGGGLPRGCSHRDVCRRGAL